MSSAFLSGPCSPIKLSATDNQITPPQWQRRRTRLNAEQIAKLKEVALKAPKNPGEWPFYLRSFQAAATPAAILELIALAERALLAAAPAPIQKDPQAAQLVTTTYAKAHSTTVIVNLVKGNVTTCLYSADHSANGKTIGVSDLPDGLSLAVKQSPEPCGGCGETDPSKRCIGCCHPFSEPSPAVTMEPATPPALEGSQVQAAGDAVDARDATLESAVQAIMEIAGDRKTIPVISVFKAIRNMKTNRFTRHEKPNADCSGEPANCPDNEGYGCACDPMNKAAKGGAA